VVAGDFDLNFDTQIDDPGGQEVARLIRLSGGQVATKIDTTTDFVVLGAPPPEADQIPEGVDDPAAVERNRRREAERKVFMDLLNEARMISIPILTRTQFLHFIGFGVPQNISDDQLPS
jgi:hypothetical protein